MNPYKILDLGHGAAKQDIIKAAAGAMRQRKYTGKEVAIAQKELMNPISKATHEFIHFIDVKPFQERLDVIPPDQVTISDLKYLNIFNGSS